MTTRWTWRGLLVLMLCGVVSWVVEPQPSSRVFSETQTLDVDANGAITFLFGSVTACGLG